MPVAVAPHVSQPKLHLRTQARQERDPPAKQNRNQTYLHHARQISASTVRLRGARCPSGMPAQPGLLAACAG
jgi:hypothetical protein